jgi:hypothetical protein
MYKILITVALQSIILKYVLENESNNCECALSWHHNYIKVFAPVIIFMAFAKLLFSNEIDKAKKNLIFKILFGIISLASFVYTITLLLYFFKLKREDCKCSEDWKRNMLLYPVVVFAIIFLLIFLVAIFSGFGTKKLKK